MEVGFYDLFTSYVMELKWYGMSWYDISIIGYSRVWYGMLVWYGMMLVWYGMLCYDML